MNENPFLEEKILKDLADSELLIPNYQRPYKWKQEHVIQLLDDLYENIYLKKTGVYRVGSVILHKDKNGITYVVDGQQRLATLTLLLKFLVTKEINFKINNGKFLLSNEKFENEISKNNIKFNYSVIQNWFNSKSFTKDELQVYCNKIQERIEFVIITVYEIDEAFQLFDSQNSRGKALEPHDLLKAFHLREMQKDGHNEAELQNYVIKWEDYLLAETKPLENILNQHLFRIRNWTKGEKKYMFSKNEINEFKGISLNKKNQFTYELQLRILDGFSFNSKNDKLLRNFQIYSEFPFQVSMPIVNGKNFFDYVFYYIQLKREIFENNEKNNFSVFYDQFCKGIYNENEKGLKYEGSGRTGDKKVRNLFENICLLYVDRFGIDYFEKVYFEEFYKNAYELRLKNKSINENSILNYEKARRFFNLIPNSYRPEELHKNLFCNFESNDWNEANYVKGVQPIFNFLKKTN